MEALQPVDAVTLLSQRLASTGIPWMITGSVAAIFYGRDRATNDIDVVIADSADDGETSIFGPNAEPAA